MARRRRVSQWSVALCAILASAGVPRAGHAGAGDDADLRDMGLSDLMGLDVEWVSSFEPVPMSRAATDVVVITRGDIEAIGARTLADILRLVPGLDTALQNDGTVRVSIRGLDDPPDILLIMDGVRINDPVTGAARYDFAASLIERVEVIRGPGSAVYGSNAILGVVRVTTRTPAKTNMAALVGSQHSGQGFFARQTTYGPWGVRSGFSYDRAEGPSFELARDGLSRSQPDVSEAPGRIEGGFERFAANLSITRGPVEVGGIVRDEVRAPYTGPISNLTRGGTYRNRFASVYARVDAPVHPGVRVSGDVSFSQWRHDDSLVLFPPGWRSFGATVDVDGDGLDEVFPDGLIENERYTARDAAIDVRATWQLDESMQLVAGVESRRAWVVSSFFETNNEARLLRVDFRDWNGREFPRVSRLFAAPYAQWCHQLGAKVRLVAGARGDLYDDFGSTVSPRATLIYMPVPTTWAQLIYGRAFRAPTLAELHNPPGVEGGNPDLAPETIQSAELKVTHRFGGRYEARAAAYVLQIDDRINVGETASQFGDNPYFNSAGTRSAGGDLTLRAQGDAYLAYANVAYHYTTDRVVDVRIASVAPLSANLVGEARVWRHAVVGGALRYRGDRDPPEITSFQRAFLSATGQGDSVVLDVNARSAALPDGWWVRGSVRNVLGSDYREIPRDAILLLDEAGGSNTLPAQPRMYLLEIGKEF